MNFYRFYTLLCVGLLLSLSDSAEAAMPKGYGEGAPKTEAGKRRLSARSDCQPGLAAIDQDVNNVRARLLTGGDVWWDGQGTGRYVVPKVGPGVDEVSSLFAGAVWLGGFDPAGSLKIAAQQYGRNAGNFDYYPGPLDPESGEVDANICSNWDKFFVVTAAEIRQHQRFFAAALAGEADYTEDMIPLGVKGWPARGNPYFEDVHGFAPPNTNQGLAGFYDYVDDEGNGIIDGLFDPLAGDLPVIEIEGCTDYYEDEESLRDAPQFPDQMIFWIYNDNGNTHDNSGSDTPLEMEVQVQAFAYSTNDALNNMTFQRYKLINRGKDILERTFFGIWIDGDLGCSEDDFIGCDTTRELAIYYNQDPVDGIVGDVCGGVPTYGSEVPIMGIDYFRGPNEFIEEMQPDGSFIEITRELGMSSFTYFNRADVGSPPDQTTDPDVGQPGQFYNYLSGLWKDGSVYTSSGTGYQTGGAVTTYAFPSPPTENSSTSWSMCSANLGVGDRRTVQASGPFTLQPGQVNELIIGVPWVPNELTYPCPSLTRLLEADDLAQNLFDECFNITDGPDAPDVDIIELERSLTLVLTNDEEVSNNAFQKYAELDLLAPDGVLDSLYRFEGYKVYQLINADVSVADLDDPSQARLIQQSDLRNGITEIFNWNVLTNPFDPTRPVFEPEPQVTATEFDQGISAVIRVTQDQFATGDDTRLVNHTPYYFTAIAYAYNSYQEFDPFTGSGQRSPYLEGRRNVITYVGVPRPITNTVVQPDAAAEVTRIDGIGTSRFFLDLAEGERERLLETGDNRPTYNGGESPVVVQTYNPFDVEDGTFRIEFMDSDMDPESDLEEGGTWQLLRSDGQVIIEGQSYDDLNEQIIGELGLSIDLGQVSEAGSLEERSNGCIGYEVETIGEGSEWFGAVPNKEPAILDQYFNFMQTESSESAFSAVFTRDPDKGLTDCFNGQWTPMGLATFNNETVQPTNGFVSPAWIGSNGARLLSRYTLDKLNNVDVVFTNDKSKWSRCVILESANDFLTQNGGISSEGDREQFALRSDPSVTKEADALTGLPIPDPVAPGEDTIRGMGWFPGYAIDVETGARLNIFFSENSAIRFVPGNRLNPYNGFADFELDEGELELTGADMMFNPTQNFILPTLTGAFENFNLIAGGQHFVYVTREPYDSCKAMFELLQGRSSQQREAVELLTYASLVLPRIPFLPYSEGLIPTETVVKLRVSNPYGVASPREDADDRDWDFPTGDNNGHPAYELSLTGVTPEPVPVTEGDSILSFVNIVPNPYYGFSEYEISEFSNIIRITNLPARANVTIYSLDGKYIRQYRRNESADRAPFTNPDDPRLNNRAINSRQVFPDLDWDLKNDQGIPVSSGIYLVHVDAFELGQRTLKAFLLQRDFDPAGL